LFLNLSDDKSIRLHIRLVMAIKQAIINSQLRPGTILPSSRQLAQSLGIARSTVTKAYEELARAGYVTARAGGKTYVADNLPQAPSIGRRISADRIGEADQYLSAFARRLNTIGLNAEWGLSISFPPRWLLPVQQWKHILGKYCNSLTNEETAPHPLGHMALPAAISGFIGRNRGISCGAEQVITFLDSESAVSYLSLWLIDEGDLVVVEEPGYVNARNMFLAHGAEVLSVPVDENGLIVDELINKVPDGQQVKLIYVTPAFHDPSGVCMSLPRRKALLEFAKEHNAIVIEDNFQGNHLFVKDIPPPLYQLTDMDNVIYVSSFWKVLFPLSLVGFAVIPEKFIPVFVPAKTISQECSPEVDRTLEEFISEGHLERHLKWVSRTLTPLRQDLIQLLVQNFGQSVKIRRQSSAYWLMVQFDQSLSVDDVYKQGNALGLVLQDTNRFYADTDMARSNEFIIPFALNEPGQ
jgi:GntR family transcriptional regulator/MocR family aminotransferase